MTMIGKTIGQLTRRAAALLQQNDGPLTRELLRNPGGFGLGQVPADKIPDATATSVCGYCSTGCGLTVHLQHGEAINLTPTTEYPVNLGMACPKGWEALSVLKAADRAVAPMIRNVRGTFSTTDWDTALRRMCERFKAIQRQHGPESIAFLGTGQITTEELAFFGALCKFGLGMIHGDANTRQCMATAAVAYKQSFGFDAPPYTYADLEESDVIVLVGSNLCIAHPILWERVCRNRRKPEIIVVDPRKTETAMAATMHLALQPKSDLALFYGLAHILIREGWTDANFIGAHTTSYDDFRKFVADFTPQRVASLTGIDVGTLEKVARLIHERERVSFWWTMGVNQSYEGVRTAQSLINLALMSGNIGRPGTGANSITGQCNAMGSRLFSNTTALFGGRDFGNTAHRREVAEVLGVDADCIPTQKSWSYYEILEGVLAGKIRGLWVVGTNGAHSWINQNGMRDVLSRLDCLVVQDMYHSTETAQMADIILPAAGWGEKEGTFINSERRLGVIRKVATPPGEALSDFAIFRLVSHYWGCDRMFTRWSDPAAAFGLLKDLSRGRPCDITGIENYEHLESAGGIQWPLPAGSENPPAERRLFADGKFFHADQRAKFLFESPARMPEEPNNKYPLLLLTGRGSAAQWHTQTRTGKSPVLRQLAPADVYIEINPDDARRLGIRPSQFVIVESQRGKIKAKTFVTPTIPAGQVFIPMHYGVTNQLTLAHFDPYSKQPSYKDCAVNVRPLASWDQNV